MYKHKQTKVTKTSIEVNTSYEGETIEQKIDRIVNNKEPIKDGAPIIYTERKDGVRPEYDIRTDRFEIAVDAMDVVNKTKLAKRENRINAENEAAKDRLKKEADKNGGAEPTQGTK